jgi:hypothetical protein
VILLVVVYNVLLLLVDLRILRGIRERGTARAVALGFALTGGAALVLAALLGLGRFRALGLFAYGVFLHLPLVLACSSRYIRGGTRVAAALTAAAIIGIGVFAFTIEPFRLEVTSLRIESPKIEAPLRVLLLSDLQTDRVGRYERDVLARVRSASPDLILMSGDYLHIRDPGRRAEVREELREALREGGLGAPLGAIAVAGNIDPPDWRRIFDGFPVEVVVETKRFDLDGVTVTALGVWESFDPDLVVPEREGFHIVLGHSPDFALGSIGADLLLAGHTHGGQVRLPFVGPLLTLSRVPRAWAAGMTRLDERRSLVVSRGVGMERGPAPRLRFLCRPELVVIDLVPAPSS